jgi:hypothetical protein
VVQIALLGAVGLVIFPRKSGQVKRRLTPFRSGRYIRSRNGDGSIVEALDEGKDIALGFGAGLVVAVMDELGLEGVEEAFHRCVVVAVGLAAHGCGDAGGREGFPIGV